MGNGYFQTYVRVTKSGTPKAIGIKFPKATLENLPKNISNDGSTCYDLDSNNEIDLNEECTGGHSRTLRFNSDLTPFRNITINWKPHGHVPYGVYDVPHFDFHFYMISDIERKQILPGSCPGLMNCIQTQIATAPVPEKYIHSDYFNTELAFSHMGNHYLDKTTPELHDEAFTQTFIFGSYNSRITYYEPMMTLDYLLSKPKACFRIKQATAFETTGYYPTKYCIRYNSIKEVYKVSLESFKFQEADSGI